MPCPSPFLGYSAHQSCNSATPAAAGQGRLRLQEWRGAAAGTAAAGAKPVPMCSLPTTHARLPHVSIHTSLLPTGLASRAMATTGGCSGGKRPAAGPAAALGERACQRLRMAALVPALRDAAQISSCEAD